MKPILYWAPLALVAFAGCGGGGIPKARYEALEKKYDQLRLENSGECATACGDCNDKVRRLEAELATLKGNPPRRVARPTPPPTARERTDTFEPVAVRVTPRRRPPPERRAPPERRPPPERQPERPADPRVAAVAASHGLASNLNEWSGTIGDGLSTVGVLRAVLAQKAQFQSCHAKALKKQPGLTAKITVTFKVNKVGKVRGLRAKSPRVRGRKLRRVMRRLTRCVRRAMKKVRFPATATGESVPVVYPVNYQP